MKFIKIFLALIIGLIVIMFVGMLIFANSIKVSVTDEDLPQDVYTETGDLKTAAEIYLLGMLVASEEDKYVLMTGFMNYMILDSIRTNINESYDPLADLDTDEADNIITDSLYYIDYVYATLNDDNQIVITIAFGSNKLIKVDSALTLVFDSEIDMSISNLGFTLTLVEYYLADKELSFKMLDFIFSKIDKTEIENSASMGVLDLDEYTYTLSIMIP